MDFGYNLMIPEERTDYNDPDFEDEEDDDDDEWWD